MRVRTKTASRQIQDPFDDYDRDLLAEGVIRSANCHSEINLRECAGGFEESDGVGVHVDDLPSLIVDSDGGVASFFTGSIGGVDEELNDIVERVFLVVPKHDTELVFHHGVRRGLQPEICFVCWD